MIRLVKPGPNDPCLCGNGKKFKHCHGAPPASPAAAAGVGSVLASAAADLRAGVWMPPQRDSTTSCERIRAKPADALLTLAGVAFRQRDYALAIERLTRLA